MRFLFACGASAGHINPALAVAGRLRELLPDSEFLFAGTSDGIEMQLVPREGYEIRTVDITSIHRSLAPKASAALHRDKAVYHGAALRGCEG